MEEDLKLAKIKQFINDKSMSKAVWEVLLTEFLKKKSDEDVYMKASRFIATELLKDSWKELERYKLLNDEETGIGKQIGL